MNRLFAIGDIHGCSTALEALIQAIDPKPGDTIVTLGDYIDRGPDSRGVIEQLLSLAKRCRLIALLRNHEEMFEGALQGGSNLDFWLKFGGEEMLRSYGPPGRTEIIPQEHVRFLETCLPYCETETHIFVHAGYWPNRRMNDQPASALFWESLEPEKASPHYSGKTAVVGHTPQTSGEILDLGFLKCIDTFCHGGGWLTALDVHNGQFWQANEQGNRRLGRLGELPIS